MFLRPFLRGLFLGGAYIWRGLSTERNLRFKIGIIGSKFPVFALFYFVFGGNFPSTSPRGGGLYLEGRFNGGFFCVTCLGGSYLEGLIHGGAYFRNFTVSSCKN